MPQDKDNDGGRPSRRGRNIPWLPVVQFHKEIAARAENSFFSIHAKDANAERWSSLESFEPGSLSGPWELEASQLTSNAFKMSLEQGAHESVFLGGPCYLGWERSFRGGFVPQWRPMLYREVGAIINGGVVEIVPEQGRWSLSPLITSAIDRLQVSVGDDPDKLVTQVLEKAATAREQDGITFAEAIKFALMNLVPELEDTLSKMPRADTFHQMPSQWVLFAPTTSFSALTRHLMADYERLESLLTENDKNIGGLKVLDDGALHDAPIEPELLPLIPLNDSQNRAVKNILGNQPLTVISGPPGCGKSQVVVSLLLNAWASGKSVLFASNNNNAVDVVRERLDRFESEFPIAVRAGNRKKNNVIELLRRTINYAADAGARQGSAGRHEEKRHKLLARRKELEQRLASELPQRADEGLRTALNAYGEWSKKLEESAAEEARLRERFKQLSVGELSLEQLETRVEATQQWLKQVEDFQSLEREDAENRSAELRRVAQAVRERNATIASIGVDPDGIQEWHWLQDGPSVELLVAWDERWSGIVALPIEEALDEIHWQSEFERWSGERDAVRTATEAKKFSETVRTRIAELAPRVLEINRQRELLDSAAEKLHAQELEERPDLERQGLRDWSTAYSTLISLPQGKTDFLPWSQPSKLRRTLKRVEAGLRQHVPLGKWREIGTLNDEGRSKLAEVVEALRTWKEALDAWDQLVDERAAVEGTLEQMRASAGSLGLEPIPTEPDAAAWREVAERAVELSKLANEASKAWARRVRQKEALETINGVIGAWRQLASGHPLKEAWSLGSGAAFVAALSDLQGAPSAANMVNARSAYYSGSLKVLERAWREAAAAQLRIAETESRLAAIPVTKDRVHEWHQARPKYGLILATREDVWPDIAAEKSELDEYHQLATETREFVDVTKPRLHDDALTEHRWAAEKLQQAINVLPASSQSVQLDGIYKQIVASPDEPWPVDQISECFHEFSPEIIRAKIDQVNADLERGSFEESKAAWLERLHEDEEALNAVDQLEKILRRKNGRIGEEDIELFRHALRLVPIWITTAQAAQAIPLEPELFDLVVIDEASQCTLTNLLPLLYRGKRLAIIGDSEQLPSIPTVQEAEELTLARKHEVTEFLSIIGHASNDVYSAAADALPRGRAGVIQLNEHFRSNPQIIGFSNRHIYQQRLLLKTDPSKGAAISVGAGVHRISIPGSVSRGERERSWKNEPEAAEVMSLIHRLRADESMRHLSIGVVTPFAAQKDYLREMLKSEGMAGEILADSAYGFQGDERDIMIFSAVVGPGITASASRWVESPPNLVNVALTRARQALFVVADFDYLMQQDPAGVLHRLALYCRDIQLLRDTSPAELELFSWMTVEGWTPKIHPVIGDIEVDFELRSESGVRLVIEVDGSIHHDESQQADRSRDAFLRAQGCQVFRTPARAVMETPRAVIHEIRQCLGL